MGAMNEPLKKGVGGNHAQASSMASAVPPTMPSENLMTSQYPALYLEENNPSYRNLYIQKLMSLGFNQTNAERMFLFECDIIRRYNKQYLLHPQFTQLWFFNLEQPFFLQYPKTKEDILKEKFLTVSELCKIIDEAEWHFWNSHEERLSDAVWGEIYMWRLKGSGADYAISYFEMIQQETGIPLENLAALCSWQGGHLNRYKWG